MNAGLRQLGKRWTTPLRNFEEGCCILGKCESKLVAKLARSDMIGENHIVTLLGMMKVLLFRCELGSIASQYERKPYVGI